MKKKNELIRYAKAIHKYCWDLADKYDDECCDHCVFHVDEPKYICAFQDRFPDCWNIREDVY